MENLAIITLVVLFVTIIIGFVKKVNVGILAIGAALIVGRMAQMSDAEIISGFNASLFFMLTGVTYLFSILQENGSLELLANKMVSLAKGKKWAIPIVVYIVGFIVPAVGPGAIPALAIIPSFSAPLAVAVGMNPLMMSMMGVLGLFGGRMTSITPEGILINQLAEEQGITNVMSSVLAASTITPIILGVIVYVYYKGYKTTTEGELEASILPKFTKEQMLSLMGVVVVMFFVLVFNVNIGIISFLVGSILLILGVADETNVIKRIPWGVLLMVTGVGVLMNIIVKVKGIELLANALSSIMTERTAASIFGLTGGVMSWFSSQLGVVLPTLVPTAGKIAETVGGNVTPTELIAAVGIAGSVAGLSPLSTGGALILASVVTSTNCSKEEENKLFINLFVWACVGLALVVLLGLLRFYRFL